MRTTQILWSSLSPGFPLVSWVSLLDLNSDIRPTSAKSCGSSGRSKITLQMLNVFFFYDVGGCIGGAGWRLVGAWAEAVTHHCWRCRKSWWWWPSPGPVAIQQDPMPSVSEEFDSLFGLPFLENQIDAFWLFKAQPGKCTYEWSVPRLDIMVPSNMERV